VKLSLAWTLVLVAAWCAPSYAQPARGVVVDQTGLPLPGAGIQLLEGERVVGTMTTAGDGTFVIDPQLPGETLLISLDGFVTRRVPRAEAARIELAIAGATETTTVIGSTIESASPTAALLGSTLTASTVARLPSAHMKARESLPLLPSVMRGADGLMQLGGAKAYDTPLTIDGFNVTDPATGVSSINLPFETVAGIEAVRDPMAITYGSLLGGLVRVESRQGTDRLTTGVQGFIPRPRFTSPGFGRIEGIFPRVHIAGSSASGRLRYVAAAEYDYERIPVPGVTDRTGDDLIEESAVVFTRVDAQLTSRQAVTFESFTFPARTRFSGLGPRREAAASVNLSSRDLFAGATHRIVANGVGVFTMQVGVLTRQADVTPNGAGPAYLSPDGWSGNWFTAVHRSAARYSAAVSWQRIFPAGAQRHEVTVAGEVSGRTLAGHVREDTVHVVDSGGRPVRSIEYGAAASFGARDRPVGLAVRDVWQATGRLQLELGVRVDHSRHGGGVPSGRAGARVALDESGVTVLKAGYGRFVGSLPLAVPAFGDYPTRTDRWLDAESGDIMRERIYRPAVGRLRLPRANALVVGVERQFGRRVDAQVAFTARRSARLATLRVPVEGGALSVESDGVGSYREFQVSARRTWDREQQLFVSYVRASSNGELNDFASIFQAMDTPLLQPAGRARTASDAPHRVLAWGTFNLPRRVVVSPVGEWRSGFPYSPLNVRQLYEGAPNARSFPQFVAVDAVIYKTFTVKRRDTDVGVQLFNLTSHRNPRDVYPVVATPRFAQFANSVGTILRGYMLLKW
jgi:hypothetical protein